MRLPEKIDNESATRSKGDTAQKRTMHRLDRHRAKRSLRKLEQPESIDHKYKGWTT